MAIILSLTDRLDLQLFAEAAGAEGSGTGSAGSGVTESAAGTHKGVKSNPLADVLYGKQKEEAQTADVQTETEAPEDRSAKFKELIKGEYKDLYDAEIQNIVQKRLKNTNEIVEKYNALMPTLETLAKKHGVNASDIKALNKAIEEDDSYYEEEALEKGMSVEQLKYTRKMERENAELKRQMQAEQAKENANKLYSDWMQQAQEAKAVYPNLDLKTELQNPQFIALLRSNIDVRTAYEVVHKDDIIRGAMQFTAKTVEQKLANSVASGGKRPAENGMSAQSAAVIKRDVSELTAADRKEIALRVARGERIAF